MLNVKPQRKGVRRTENISSQLTEVACLELVAHAFRQAVNEDHSEASRRPSELYPAALYLPHIDRILETLSDGAEELGKYTLYHSF